MLAHRRGDAPSRWLGRAAAPLRRQLWARDTFTEGSDTALTSHVADFPLKQWVPIATQTQAQMGMVNAANDQLWLDMTNSNPRSALPVALPRHGNFTMRLTVPAFNITVEARGVFLECYQGPAVGLGNNDQNRRWNITFGWQNYLTDQYGGPSIGIGGDALTTAWAGDSCTFVLDVRQGRYLTGRVYDSSGALVFWRIGQHYPATMWWPGLQLQNQGVIPANVVKLDNFEVWEGRQ